MPLKGYQSILTADVVNSSSVKPQKLETLLQKLAAGLEGKATVEFFRGDSLQTLVSPEEALHLALQLRADIIAADQGLDFRIAIGTGQVTHHGKTLAQSAGDAFERSGHSLDTIKGTNERLRVSTPSEEWNQQLYTECMLAEGIIRRWTPLAAATVSQVLRRDETQEEIARRLKIAQPAVAKRLATADWRAIRHWEAHYRLQLHRYLGAV
jgi:hypothetical protein